jgi:acetoin utilization deacetylase AcuC-like enzyme
MLTFYSDTHRLHHGKTELYAGTLVPCFEMPSRADMVLEQVRRTGLGEVREPQAHGLDPVLAVHDAGYVAFLETAWERWQALGRDYDALPKMWQIRRLRQAVPEHVEGQLCYYSMDCGTPLTSGTWPAITRGADLALSGADALLAGDKAAFALTRPPGHHAARDYCGGYCFFNNAAIAAQYLRDRGAKRVSVLDVDYHHGNGTQDIFYRRADVQFLSVHGHPRTEYPFFLGFSDECGEGEGLGFNHNFPLPAGSDVPTWMGALDQAAARIADFAPDFLVVSLGVDAFAGDPISRFALQSQDFCRIGERLASLGIPALFCLEGGYAVEPIGVNAVNVLSAFDAGI